MWHGTDMQPITELNPYWARLEVDLAETSGIVVPNGQDEAAYFEGLRSDVRRHATMPDWVSATVVQPGFRHREIGSRIAGYLLSKSEGYWLVFEPEEGEYYCFWEQILMIWVHTASAETLFIVGGSKNAKAVFLLIFLKTERARFAFYLLQLPLRVRPPNAVGLRSAKSLVQLRRRNR